MTQSPLRPLTYRWNVAEFDRYCRLSVRLARAIAADIDPMAVLTHITSGPFPLDRLENLVEAAERGDEIPPGIAV